MESSKGRTFPEEEAAVQRPRPRIRVVDSKNQNEGLCGWSMVNEREPVRRSQGRWAAKYRAPCGPGGKVQV